MTIFEEMLLTTLKWTVQDELWSQEKIASPMYMEMCEYWMDIILDMYNDYGLLHILDCMENEAHFIICQAEGRPA